MTSLYSRRFGLLSRAVPVSVLALMVIGAVAARPVLSQENAAEENFRVTVSQSVRATENLRLNENSRGTTYSTDTTFSFGHRFESGVQSLSLSGLAVARLLDDPVVGSDFGISDADANVDYLREGANARLRLQSRYVRTDLGFADPLQAEEVTEEDLANNIGERTNIDSRLLFEAGLRAPLGARLQLRRQDQNYENTTDPDLFDTVTESLGLTIPLRLSASAEGQLSYSASQYEAEDGPGTDRDSKRLTIGVEYELSPITALSFEVGRSEVIETFDTIPGFEDRDDGTVYAISLTRETPNGSIGVSFDSNITQDGRRSTFLVNREIALPDGALTWSLGTSDGSNSDLRPIGSLNLRKENGRTTLRAGVSRAVSISTTSSDVTETTRLNLGYELQLTELSSLSMDVRYANIADLNAPAGEVDRRRASFDVALNRQVTDDWDFVTGYQFRHARRDTGSSGNSNALFFTLRRDFGGLN